MGTKRYQFKTGSKCRTCLNNVNGSNQKKEWKYSAEIATYHRSKYKSVFSLGANCDAAIMTPLYCSYYELDYVFDYHTVQIKMFLIVFYTLLYDMNRNNLFK